ncbi:MAG: phosphate acetyltransferase [Verrucomicrobiota bacterium]|jgi:phosphate acetyltransferase|nr:phosphate acetyltransferase [Verrucomicrobiota bacterium]MDK2962687.1 phosphate acetyltransferase [Verrucomicrobiota bacterium]
MSRSEFIQGVIEIAKANPRTIVLPEGADERVTTAANLIVEEKIANVIVLGDESVADRVNSEVTVINPLTSDKLEGYALSFYELRKSKGITLDQARETVRQFTYFGMMMVQNGDADGLVSGAVHSTADTVRPALQIIKGARKGGMVSALFFMVSNNVPYIFSDSGLVENPDADQLAQIAVQSAQTAKQFNIPATVAMLSYSTKGSASSPLVDKVVEATEKAKKLIADEFADQGIELDGELQLDAAIVPSVAALKAPGSTVAGKARVLIFPDLNAGNIGYKLVQRLGGAEAYGPILQGLKKPVNDLSRGCIAADIVGVAAITVVQSL